VLDIRKLRLFVAVYEGGSLSRAAEREHIAQPALSVHIQQLEDDLGVKLFERSAHGMTPVPAGRHFYGLCLDLLRRIDAVGLHMSRFKGTLSGVVRAGIMPSICHGPLAPVLASYTAAHPNVDVRIVEALSGTLAQWVLSDEVDFAICTRPDALRGIESRPLIRDRLVLVSGKAAGFLPFEPCELASLPGLKLVLPSAQHSLRHTLDRHIAALDLTPSQTLEIDGQSATLQFVAHSDWSTILPTIAVVNEFEGRRVTLNPIVKPELSTEICELRSSRHTLSAAAERFVAMLEAALCEVPTLPLP
jgi:LysR family transcriptional regulator, nitrogen assimilation regulatory protein